MAQRSPQRRRAHTPGNPFPGVRVAALVRGLVGVGDAHVGRPRGGLSLLHVTHEPADVLTVLLEHPISAVASAGPGSVAFQPISSP